jgi:hypothetical protein
LVFAVVLLVAGLPWERVRSRVPLLRERVRFWTAVGAAGLLIPPTLYALLSTGTVEHARYGMWLTVLGFVVATSGLFIVAGSRDPDGPEPW